MLDQNNRYRLIDSVMLFALVSAVYGRIIGYDFQHFYDDNWWVIYDEFIRGFSWNHIRTAFSSNAMGLYMPMQRLSYMLDYSLWGLNSSGFHFSNIILHLINGLLVYRLLIDLYRERLPALFAAAIFLIHPVQVETVAWITQRRTLLCMLFFLLAWEFYRRYCETAKERRWPAYGASVAFFLLALLSKSIAVILPVVLILYDICFLEKGRRIRIADKIPYVLTATVVVVMLLVYQSEPGGARVSSYYGGSPLATFYTMLTVYCRYLGMLIWPSHLSVVYAPQIRYEIDVWVGLSALLLSVVLLAGVKLFSVDRRRGLWVIFFFVGLLPVSQIVPIISLMNDRYLYFPLVGVAALAGFGAERLLQFFRGRRWLLAGTVLALPVLVLSAVSFERAAVWQNSLTLFTDAIKKEPKSDKAWEILGDVYQDSGKMDAACQAYERAVLLNSTNPDIMQRLGELYTNLDELDKGYSYLSRLVAARPDFVTGWASLGNNYLKRGDYGNAERAYLRAQELQPDAMQVVTLLGNLARIRERFDQARTLYMQVESKGWNQPETAYHLACVEAMAGRSEEALAWLEKALQRGLKGNDKFYDGQLSSIWEEPRFKDLLQQWEQQ